MAQADISEVDNSDNGTGPATIDSDGGGATEPATISRRRRRANGEDGVVLMIVAVSLVVLVAATALTIDLGRQMMRRRDMQLVADVVSLDMARLLDGRTRAQLLSSTDWAAQLTDSRDRNDFPDTGAPRHLDIALGHIDSVTRAFVEDVAASSVPTAVRVNAGDSVEYFFASGGQGAAARKAVATQTGQACFTVGSFAANISGNNSLLGSVLGDAMNIGVLSYQGLATAQGVTLGQIGAELGLGSPTQVLGTNVTINQFAAATARVLRLHGDNVNANLLDTVAVSANNTFAFRLGQLASVAAGSETAALAVPLNVLDVVSASALIANGTNFIALPLQANLLGLSTLSARVTIIEGPVLVCQPPGGPQVQTSQVRLSVDATVLDLFGVQTVRVHIGLDAVNARANVVSAGCGTPQRLDVGINSSLISPNLAVFVLGIPLNVVSPPASTPATSTISFAIPPDVLGVTMRSTTGSTTLTTTGTFGGNPGGLLGPLAGPVVNTLVAALGPVFDPISRMLGIRVGGADVVPVSIDCAAVKLVQ
ncbi:MAG: hypothetical protein ACT4PW_08030 [Acidimicrobiia bacterium]